MIRSYSVEEDQLRVARRADTMLPGSKFGETIRRVISGRTCNLSIGFNAPPLVHRLGAVPQDTLRHRIPHNPAQGTLQGLKHDVNGQTRNAL